LPADVNIDVAAVVLVPPNTGIEAVVVMPNNGFTAELFVAPNNGLVAELFVLPNGKLPNGPLLSDGWLPSNWFDDMADRLELDDGIANMLDAEDTENIEG